MRPSKKSSRGEIWGVCRRYERSTDYGDVELFKNQFKFTVCVKENCFKDQVWICQGLNVWMWRTSICRIQTWRDSGISNLNLLKQSWETYKFTIFHHHAQNMAGENLPLLRKSLCCDCYAASSWKPECLNGVPPVIHFSTTAHAIQAATAVSSQDTSIINYYYRRKFEIRNASPELCMM